MVEGGVGGLTKSVKSSGNVRIRKDRGSMELHNVGAAEKALEGAKSAANGSTNNTVNKRTMKARTMSRRETKGKFSRHIQVDSDSLKAREGRQGDVEGGIGVGHLKSVKGFSRRRGSLEVEKTSVEVAFREREIKHSFIKSNVRTSLNGVRLSVEVENILGGFGKTKEDASASIRESFVRTTRAGRESVDTSTKHTKRREIRLLAGANFVGTFVTIAMDGNIVET